MARGVPLGLRRVAAQRRDIPPPSDGDTAVPLGCGPVGTRMGSAPLASPPFRCAGPAGVPSSCAGAWPPYTRGPPGDPEPHGAVELIHLRALNHWPAHSAVPRLLAALIAGTLIGAATGAATGLPLGFLAGIAAAEAVFVVAGWSAL